jgi:cytochrome c biogenesis protein CcmG/thiol:disulfide interchange protein DsbE
MSTLTPSGPGSADAPDTGGGIDDRRNPDDGHVDDDHVEGGAGSSGGSPDDMVPGSGRPRRRLAMWLSLGALVLVAALVAILASSKPAAEVLTNSPLLGRAAPQISGSAILNGPAGGGPVQLSADRGEWVLVNFAASWCVPCQEEMPQLLLFAKQHAAAHDATILTVAYDENDIGNLRRFLQERSVTWPTVDESSAKITWGVGELPQSFLVDPRGTVVAVVEGQADAADLDALITKYSPQAAAGS